MNPSPHVRGNGRASATKHLLPALVFAGFLSATITQAQVSVDCDTPDDFCTGTPCDVTQELTITVASCVLDFSGRTLNINGKVNVPNNGTLSLTAGAINVNEKIVGRHIKTGAGDGADVSLIATGNIVVSKRIEVSGHDSVGSITLDAGGNIDLNSSLRARTKGGGATAAGGTVTVAADGTLSSAKRGKVDVRGKKKVSAAGTATMSGGADVNLKGRIEARGSSGGTVVVTSSTGDVAIEEELRTQGSPNGGGSVTISATGTITIGGEKGKALAHGNPGGSIALGAGGAVTLNGNLRARGKAGGGGSVSVTSTTGDISAPRGIRVDSSQGPGGSITLSGNNLTLSGGFDARSKVAGGGGDIVGTAVGDLLTAGGKFRAADGGCIGLSAGGTLDLSGEFDLPVTSTCP